MEEKVKPQDVEAMLSDALGSDARATASDTQRSDKIGERSPRLPRHSSHQLQLRADTSSVPTSHTQNPQPYPYNMSSMANTLPDYGHAPQDYPQHAAGPSPPGVVYTMPQQPLPYPPQGVAYGSPTHYGAYPQQFPTVYGHSPSAGAHAGYGSPYPPGQGQARLPNIATGHFQQAPVPYYYYPDPYGTSPTGFPSQGPQPSYPGGIRSAVPNIPSQFPDHGRRASGRYRTHQTGSSLGGQESGTRMRDSATTAIPRGPPRKPKQSGHALWVGNLPPGASILALKDHFARDAKREIESLFLISKSNCAFVNYRSEEACEKAVARFHDSRFQGVRLVCRLRKTSSAAPGVPTGPAAMLGQKSSHLSPIKTALEDGADTRDLVDGVYKTDGLDGLSYEKEPGAIDEDASDEDEPKQKSPSPERAAERYFIVKSLTLQDLEQSVKNGIWATQAHNEHALNKAYDSADNVYLIFSANKSGEYFGYARMSSQIAENAAEVYGTVRRTDTSESNDVPKSINTPATEFAPKGHIIDDSARGTIFWEAEYSDDEFIEDTVSEVGDPEPEPPTWGKPFRVEWLATSRLPFYRTRGLRNPWNSNREVKIARDGTELEPSVGAKLLQLFHRPGTGSHSQGPSPVYGQ